jgi:hypothetical protein
MLHSYESRYPIAGNAVRDFSKLTVGVVDFSTVTACCSKVGDFRGTAMRLNMCEGSVDVTET